MMKTMKTHALWLSPLCGAVAALLLTTIHMPIPAAVTAGVAVLCAGWWVFEPVPVPVTSLVPMAIFPLTGILSGKEVAAAYGHPLIMLLMGGFILSQAMASTGTHRILAFRILSVVGAGSPKRLIIGFGITAAVMSMWISNTATTLMLIPIAIALLSEEKCPQLKAALLLAIAYCASIGGIATPIGSPPNLIFIGVYKETTGTEISFSQWMSIGIPVVVTFIPLVLYWLCRKVPGNRLQAELPEIPAMRAKHKRVLAIFALTAIAWVTRKEPWGGWSSLLGIPTSNDAAVALVAVVLLFVISDKEGGKLLTWEDANKIPWGILLLFAGGLTLAAAFGKTGLTVILAEQLQGVTVVPALIMIVSICLVLTFLTEVTSNTATTTLFMPVLAAVGLAADIDPILLMLPAAMSASCAFMLPVATAPNAIVYGSGHIPIQTMIQRGFALNILGIACIAFLCYLRL